MGNSQSRPSSPGEVAQEKALLERLRTLQLDRQDGWDEDYVYVGDKKQNDQMNEKGPVTSEPREPREPEGLSVSEAERWQTELLRDPKNRLALSVLSAGNPREVLTSRAATIADQQVFNVQIPFEGGPITNQRSSGRCWLFASTNVFRVALMQKYNLDSFELSQAYLFFWDKLEKANWFLEQVISTAGEPLDGRLVQTLLQEPLSDGGQWDMVYNLVDKYGLVPQVLYPDSFNARSSSVVNSIVFTKLRQGALALRRLAAASPSGTTTTAEALSRAKAKLVREIHAILTLTLGPPPAIDAEFEWDFVDKAGHARAVRATPRAFAQDLHSTRPNPTATIAVTPASVAGMISLVHDPRHPPLRLLSVDRLGNVVGGRGVRYVNVDMPGLKRACVAQLRAGLPVFFGCDVGKFSSSARGLMDTALIDYQLGFPGVDVLGGLDKAERLRTGESAMTHAMVLTAVHVVDEGVGGSGERNKKKKEKEKRTVRWRVQNSWGEDAGDKGWFVMTDAWMDHFVYQAVIDPRFLGSEVRDVLRGEPIVLPLWDPMGSLA